MTKNRPAMAMDAATAVVGYLRRQHFEHVPVRIAEIEAAAAATAIDLHVIKRAGAAAISNSLGAHPLEDLVELRLIDLEGVVVALEVRIVVEIERQRVVDPQRSEAREGTFVAQAQDAGAEAGGCLLVLRRYDRVVEKNSHRRLLRPLVTSLRRCVAGFKALAFVSAGLNDNEW